MKVFVIPSDEGNYITASLKDAIYNAECELERLEPGEELTISIEEMTQEELDALPEYTR